MTHTDWPPYIDQTWWPFGPPTYPTTYREPLFYTSTSTGASPPCTHCWCDEETRGSKEVLHERCCKCQDVRLPAKEDADAT